MNPKHNPIKKLITKTWAEIANRALHDLSHPNPTSNLEKSNCEALQKITAYSICSLNERWRPSHADRHKQILGVDLSYSAELLYPEDYIDYLFYGFLHWFGSTTITKTWLFNFHWSIYISFVQQTQHSFCFVTRHGFMFLYTQRAAEAKLTFGTCVWGNFGVLFTKRGSEMYFISLSLSFIDCSQEVIVLILSSHKYVLGRSIKMNLQMPWSHDVSGLCEPHSHAEDLWGMKW